jgi:hypothetical protein
VSLDYYGTIGTTILIVTLTTLAFGYAPGVRRWGFLAGLIFWTAFGLIVISKHYHFLSVVRYILTIR